MGVATVACIGVLALFFFAPVIYMYIELCNTDSGAYVSFSYYLFNHGEAYYPEAGHFAWLTYGPVVCV